MVSLVSIGAILLASLSTAPVRPLVQEAPSAPAASPATPAPRASVVSPEEQLVLPGATRAPDCGGKPQLAALAFCVTAPIGQVGALADSYIAKLGELGWIQADGRDNLVVFVRRRDAGGCDGLQMLAFYDETKPVEETSPAYLGLATIPGDVCATQGPAAAPTGEPPAAPAPAPSPSSPQ